MSIYDPIEVQEQELKRIEQMDVGAADFVSPAGVQFLVGNQTRLLAELRARDGEIRQLRDGNAVLRNERENLRVQCATVTERYSIGWVEILVSFIGGYAINILSNQPGSSLGWFLLIISVLTIFGIRFSFARGIQTRFDKPTMALERNQSDDGN